MKRHKPSNTYVDHRKSRYCNICGKETDTLFKKMREVKITNFKNPRIEWIKVCKDCV